MSKFGWKCGLHSYVMQRHIQREGSALFRHLLELNPRWYPILESGAIPAPFKVFELQLAFVMGGNDA